MITPKLIKQLDKAIKKSEKQEMVFMKGLQKIKKKAGKKKFKHAMKKVKKTR